MIASWRALSVAAVLAVALVAIVAVDVARRPVAVDRALVPGFDPARATALVWDRAGQPAIRVERAGERWEIRAPAAVPADATAIGEVLAALRGARWHRRGEAPAPHATLTVLASGGERHVLGIAGPIAGTEQSWIVDDGRGVVVDSWVARALDRDRLALQLRRPLADISGARSIAITGSITGPNPGSILGNAAGAVELRIEGSPRRLVQPSALLLDPPIVGELERALREIVIVRIPDIRPGAQPLTIRATWSAAAPPAAAASPAATAAAPAAAGPPAAAADITVALGGDCPGEPSLVAATGSAGDGCIDRAAADAVAHAVARLAQPPQAIVDRRPAPLEPRQIVLLDGALLTTAPPRIDDAPADPVRVVELLAALAAPAQPAPLPTGRPIGKLTATDPAGAAISLDVFADHLVARRGEPVALRPTSGAWSLVTRPARGFRDLTLWAEEPTTITSLDIDGVHFERGAVIGAWTRRPPGAVDAARVEALVGQLAAPRALAFRDAPLTAAHRVTIEVTPPAGAAVQHVLELGAHDAGGCPARAGRDAIILPAALCTQLTALLPR